MTEAQRRVLRGALALDDAYPGWEQYIDLKLLDLFDPRYDVVGQLIPFVAFSRDEIYDRLRELAPRDEPVAVTLGLIPGTSFGVQPTARGLHDAWGYEIANRQEDAHGKRAQKPERFW